MTRLLPAKHGDTHRPGGSDPVVGGYIAFEVANLGNFLHIEANSMDFVTDTGGMSFTSHGNDISTLVTNGNDWNLDVDGTINLRARTGNFNLAVDAGDIDLEAVTNINLYASAGPIYLQGTPNVQVQLLTLGFFNVKDQAGNDIFRVDENATVHIKTGTLVVADL